MILSEVKPYVVKSLKVKFFLIFTSILLGSFFQVHATHVAGADLTYKWISGNSFEITATVYRDCEGIAAPANISLDYSSATCGYSLNVTLLPIPGTGQEITHPCSTATTKCSGGTNPGIQKWEYRATVTLPAQCTDWIFGFTVNARNCAITTLSYPGNSCSKVPSLYVQSTLNNVAAPTNSSPDFTTDPVAFFCIGQQFNYNHGALDSNGDSLVYSWVTPRDNGPNTYVTFNGGFSASNPMSSSPPITLNSTNGSIVGTPTALQVGVMAILVKEYRNGVLVGSVIRDMEYWTQTCSNVLPTATGINGSASNFDLHVCAGQPINFTINSADGNPGQIVTMTWNNGIPGASFTSAGSPYPIGTFSWNPTAADARTQPYTFIVTVKDNNCPSNGYQNYSYSITVSKVAPVVATTNSVCSTPGTGTASVSVSSGVTPYTYSWNPGGATTSSISNLQPGTYTVTVTDAFGCTSTASNVVTAPTSVSGSIIASANVSCNGAHDGSAAITASGGTSPYTYSWSPSGGLGSSASGLGAGNYNVTITDAHSCIKVVPVPITQPIVLASAISSQTNVLCNGNNTGSATVTASGGTAPYSYDWLPNGSSTATSSGLSAGNYSVVVTDAHGCITTSPVTITQPTALSTSATSSPAICGSSNGTASVTSVTGGTGPYTYLWTPGNATTSGITGLVAGAYSVKVTDAHGCTVTNAVGVSNMGGPAVSVSSVSPVSCSGGTNGSASVFVTGGSAPFTYQWTPSGGTAPAASNLSGGSYTVTVKDANNCISSLAINISQPPPLQLSMSSTDPTCAGANNGSASVSVTGGSGSYNYSWSPGGSASASLSTLVAGNYSVTVTDGNGCTKLSSTLLIQPTVLSASLVNSTSVACNGGNNGSASITSSGGTTPYTYSWSPVGGSLPAASGLAAGNYSVTVTDANNCIRVVPVVISQPVVLSSAVTPPINPLCNGGNNGSTSVIASGGTSPYSYLWSSGGTLSSANGLTAGNYDVTVTDAHGCTSLSSTSISQPPVMTTSVLAPVDVLCFGGNNGSATVSVSGGTPGYLYAWSPSGGNGASASSLVAGTYTVTTTDAKGCTNTSLVFINQPAILNGIASSVSNVNCFGSANGSAAINVSGGSTPYTYSWSPSGGTSDTATNLIAGVYTVDVIDANGCVTSSGTTIAQPPLLQLSPSSTSATCGASNGSVSVSASGGKPGYTYSWSPVGGTNPSATNLPASSYTVTVTDTNGCQQTAIASISNLGGPTAVANISSNVLCNGGNDGSASVNISSGTAPFNIVWSPSGGTGTIASNLTAGNYSVTVADFNGCVTSSSIEILEPPILVLSPSYSDVICNGNANGTAGVLAVGGTPNYNYSWSAGATTSSMSNLSPGAYTVTVSDQHGCSENSSVTVSEPASLTASLITSNVLCTGNADGAASVAANGGTPGYSYTWSPAVGTGTAAFNLSTGSYSVTVTDVNGCTASTSAFISQPLPLAVSIASSTNVNCNGQDNGAASVNVAGGTVAYSYLWSPSGGTTANAVNLAAGLYTIAVTDTNGCTATESVTITEPSVLTSVISSLTDVSCNNGSDGAATVAANGGTVTYTYSWTPSGGNSTTAQNLSAGNYNVVVTDNHGRTSSSPVTIVQPQPLIAAINSSSDVDCNGGNNGSASVNVGGGTVGYSYSWLPSGGAGSIANNLTAGPYTVQVSDANGCATTAAVTIHEPPILVLQATPHAALCSSANGSASVVVGGGVTPYSYSWSPSGGTGSSANNLAAGQYIVTVTDGHGCQDNATATVANLGGPSASLNVASNVSCNGGSNGSASVNIVSGTAPYAILWSPSNSTGTTASGLSAGPYTVFVTDVNGCVASDNITISEPAPLTALASSSDALCNGSATGSVSVNAAGGTAGYFYSWSPSGGVGSTANNLSAGNYTVTVTDINGCTKSASTIVAQPLLLNLSMSSSPTLCNGASDGSASVTVTGGTSGYTYSWFPAGGSDAIADSVSVGNYTVTVTDAHGCTSNNNINVSEPAAVDLQTSASPSTCGSSNGTATVVATGGTGPYSYLWSAASSMDSIATGLPAGSCIVTVTDAHGCQNNATASVSNIGGPTISASVVQNVSCNNGNNGVAMVDVSNGTAPFSYAWSPISNTTSNIANLSIGNYSVTVTDANGCISADNVSISQPTAVVAFASSGNALCNGSSDGSVSVNVNGGTPGYAYVWSPGGATDSTTTNLSAGNYTVVITDANGCTQSASTVVDEPTLLNLSMSSSPALCNGGNTGSASVTVTGGTSGYLYAWQPSGGSGTVATNISSGNYSVNVTDAHGCTSVNAIQVAEPTALNLQTAAQPSLCGASNGSTMVAVTGGIGPYSYLWSPSGGIDSSAHNLSSGSYTAFITDANGCRDRKSISVSDMGGPTITASVVRNVSCNNGSNGAAMVNVSNGTAPFSYSWSPVANNTSNAGNLPVGSYSITVTDANGCVSVDNVSISQPTAVTAVASSNSTLCNGSSDGSVLVNVNGGTPGYSYAWSSGGTNDSIATNLSAGNYSVVITDANGCTKSASTVVGEPTLLNLSMSSSPALCNGSVNGSASVVVTGGTSGYFYSWSPSGGSGSVAANISAGNYSVNVTDAHGCTSVNAIQVSEPIALNLQTASQPSLCGSSNGSTSVTASGGTSPYFYQWLPSGGTDSSAHNLSSGSYTVVVTDAHGCLDNKTAGVSDIGGPTIAASVNSNVSCHGGNNGSASVSISNGTAPFTYSWSVPGNTTNSMNLLTAGNYSVTVRDANGCISVDDVSIIQPAILTAFASSTNALCFGSFDGNAQVNAAGGTAPYVYGWSPVGGSDSIARNLEYGNYSVTITDNNGCTKTAATNVSQPAQLNLAMSSSPALCNGAVNGTASVVVSGGTSGYTYAWLPSGGNSRFATNLSAGNYSVNVTDAHGCTSMNAVYVDQPLPLNSSMGMTPALCNNSSDGTASADVSGGTFPYAYLWSPSGGTGRDAANLHSGNYDVIITDVHGCTQTKTVLVTAPPALNLSPSSTPALCNGSSNGSADVNAVGGTPPYQYHWSHGVGTNQQLSSVPAGTYTVVVTDRNGCAQNTSATVNEPTPLSLAANGAATICIGQNTLISANASGGTSPYSFAWSNGTTTSLLDVNPVNTTSYSVTATDMNGCTVAQQSVTVTLRPPLAIVANGANPICAGTSTNLSALASGGDGNYTYTWDHGVSGNSIRVFPTATTTYIVTVHDGCGTPSARDQVSLTVNPLPEVNFVPKTIQGCTPVHVDFLNYSATPAGSTYHWNFGDLYSDGSLNPSHDYTVPGTYTVSLVVTTPQGCSNEQIIQEMVTVHPYPVAGFNQSASVITFLENGEVEFLNTSTGATMYDWDFGDGSPIEKFVNTSHRYRDTGTYEIKLIVSTNHGCTDITYGKLIVIDRFTIYIPNAFTPNGDGINDGFIALGIGWTDYKMSIIDRWGKIIYQSNSKEQSWDGTYFSNSTLCQNDVYEYVINVRDNNGMPHDYIGHVTLVR